MRVNKTKVLIGGAIKRKNPSKASEILLKLNLLEKDVLDYGCGYGFDADYFKWDKFDPYYFGKYPDKKYNNIVCIHNKEIDEPDHTPYRDFCYNNIPNFKPTKNSPRL